MSAQSTLQKILGYRPKRPIYYVWVEIDRLPHWTRFAIENMGHFVDIMLKCVAAEKLSNSKCLKHSFGSNLNRLKNEIPDDLFSILEEYNNLIYVPAKHDHIVINRDHLFTCKEVVFTIFIALKIKERLIKISDDAKNYVEEKDARFPN